ncbi:MAG: DUF2249 domain-containing protein [Pseudomonadota bacterium]
MSTTATATPEAIDMRSITPRERHALVFGRFDALQAGQAMQLVNDHDPQPLRFQLDDRAFGQFAWLPLESGPAVWRVQITRVGAQPLSVASGGCCSGGACCG